MKRLILFVLCTLLLAGCTSTNLNPTQTVPVQTTTAPPPETEIQNSTAATEPISTTAPLIPVNIYVPDENAENFNTVPTVISEADAQMILELLIDCGVLNENIVLNSIEIDGSQVNLDFNTAFADQLMTYGTSGERMMIGSVVNTYLSFYDAETVYITVDGQIMESGHVIYDFPLTFFS